MEVINNERKHVFNRHIGNIVKFKHVLECVHSDILKFWVIILDDIFINVGVIILLISNLFFKNDK